MQMVDNLKQIVEYVCENFEYLDMDDPVEEGYLDNYEEILGATEEEISAFKEKLGISLPEDVKELYRYKNGSKFFSLSHDFWNLGGQSVKRISGHREPKGEGCVSCRVLRIFSFGKAL